MIKNFFIKKTREDLEKQKKELENALEGFAKKNKGREGNWDVPFPQFKGSNLEEEADEVEEYETLLPIEHSLENRLKDINLALEKIKKRAYGICEKCKNHIPKERLKVAPEARFCLKCKS